MTRRNVPARRRRHRRRRYRGAGRGPGFTAMDIQALAVREALDDAGLTLSDVDGIFCANMSHTFPVISTLEYLGIKPRWIDGTNIGGSACSPMRWPRRSRFRPGSATWR